MQSRVVLNALPVHFRPHFQQLLHYFKVAFETRDHQAGVRVTVWKFLFIQILIYRLIEFDDNIVRG